jgi:hypothetical protein
MRHLDLVERGSLVVDAERDRSTDCALASFHRRSDVILVRYNRLQGCFHDER